MKKLICILLVTSLFLLVSAVAEENQPLLIEAPENIVYIGKTISLTPITEQLAEKPSTKITYAWSSSDKSIARVDIKGTVTGVAVGNVTITCQEKNDESISASVQIEVRANVKTLTLKEKSVTILLGVGKEKSQIKLSAEILPENSFEKTISWSSSNESVATVDGEGIVQAIAAGKATIKATSNDQVKVPKTVSCIVTVGQAVKSIKLSQDSITIQKGKILKVKAVILPEDASNKGLTWITSNKDIVNVDAAGSITARKTGNATITCTAKDGSAASASCKVTVVQNVTSITSKTTRLVILEGETSKVALTFSPKDATDKKVTWSSSSSYIASVNSSGIITAKNSGDAVITATAVDGGGKKYSVKIIVEPANPISLESIGFGIYMPNLLGVTVYNRCKTKSITDFDFDLKLYSFDGSTINSGSYSLGKPITLGGHQTRTIKRTVFGVGYATKVVMTITDVTFSDGSYYSIPYSLQDSWTFRR